ncbi:MAG: transcriptional regulator [Gordonia sp. (in: high G+C Gram-positive bacteria)]
MSSMPARRRHRPALAVLVVVAAAACLALAWWQWSRFESTSGSFQNLGYALQWPAFAVAVIWAYRRFVVLESDPDEARRATITATEVPAGLLPERAATPSASSFGNTPDADGDRTLAEYNQYLAELNRKDRS